MPRRFIKKKQIAKQLMETMMHRGRRSLAADYCNPFQLPDW